jgi:hypothetical protein
MGKTKSIQGGGARHEGRECREWVPGKNLQPHLPGGREGRGRERVDDQRTRTRASQKKNGKTEAQHWSGTTTVPEIGGVLNHHHHRRHHRDPLTPLCSHRCSWTWWSRHCRTSPRCIPRCTGLSPGPRSSQTSRAHSCCRRRTPRGRRCLRGTVTPWMTRSLQRKRTCQNQ